MDSYQRAIAVAFIILGGLLVFNSLSGITGFAIAENVERDVSAILGLAFVVGGLIMFMAGKREEKEGGLAREVKKSGTVILDPKKLIKISRKSGYSGEYVKEGYRVYGRDGKPLTVIPNHDISKGVYRSIINALATGEPSFRKRTGYLSS